MYKQILIKKDVKKCPQCERRLEWTGGKVDESEKNYPPKRSLLKFLQDLNKRIPKRWNLHTEKFEQDDDWLLLETEK